nr:MAG TPA: hypothetical protein [Caudoviricetes sp.]
MIIYIIYKLYCLSAEKNSTNHIVLCHSTQNSNYIAHFFFISLL